MGEYEKGWGNGSDGGTGVMGVYESLWATEVVGETVVMGRTGIEGEKGAVMET